MNRILLPLLLLIQISAEAQHNTGDLLRLLQNKKEDTNKVWAYSTLAWEYQHSDPDSAILLAQQGLALAKQLKFTKGEASCMNELGSIMSITGNYPLALELHLAALEKYEALNNQIGIGSVLSSIGADYLGQEDYQQALHYFFKSKQVSENIRDTAALMTDLINIGDCYEKLNRLDSARLFVQRSYEIALSLDDTYATGVALNNLGNIYSKMSQPVIAMEFYRSALPAFIDEQDDDGVCETTLGMAKLFKQTNQTDSCLYYAKLSLTTAQSAGFLPRVLNASNFLSEHYKAENNVDSAFVYLTAMTEAKDSLFSQEKSRQLQNLSLQETIRQQDISIQKAEEAQERRANIQYAAIALGLIIFISMFLLLSRSIIVNEKWIEFLGILGLLIVFEFINLIIHPYLAAATHHSPVLMLLVLVAIAAVLVPLHHKVEHWVVKKMVEKNKRIRLAAAKRIVARLEPPSNDMSEDL